MKARRIPLFVLLIISGSALADDGDVPSDQPAKFKITTKRKDDTVEVRADKEKTVFGVKSPFGISQAVIEREAETWPAAVVLRLHLKGLESFRASNGKVTVDAAVSSQEGQMKVRIWKDGKENAPLNEKNPFWTVIRIVGGDGKPAKEPTAQGRVFRDVAAQGVVRGAAQVDHVELDRLLPAVIFQQEGQPFSFATPSITPRSSSPLAPQPFTPSGIAGRNR
jgi:hypothetical protein